MALTFSGEVWYWKGPAPWYFVTVPPADCQALQAAAGLVSYGWGMLPVTARIGGSVWQTSLFPKGGGYIVPIKAAVRQAQHLDEGQRVTVQLEIGPATAARRA